MNYLQRIESTVKNLPNEKWVETKYNGYFASNLGRIQSMVKRKSGKIEWFLLTNKPRPDGYIRICLNKKYEYRKDYAHRIIASAFIDNPDNKPFVNHIDGNKSNNYIYNLEWATRSENAQHAMNILGVKSMGSVHYLTKLTDEDVAMIKKMRGHGVTLKQIAEIYDIQLSTIGKITTGVNWKHIKAAI